MEALLVIWLLFGIVTAVVMTNKGRSGCGGFALGVLLGPFGLIIALVLGSDQSRLDRAGLQSGKMRKCPHCAEAILSEASKCRYCGSSIDPLTR